MSIDQTPTHPLAEEIADGLLYRTGRAFFSADLDEIFRCFALPHLTETREGRQLLDTEDAFVSMVSRVRAFFRTEGIVDFARTVHEARFLTSDIIGSTHVTRLLRADNAVFGKPYPVYSILKEGPEGWQAVSSTYAILELRDLSAALHGAPGELPERFLPGP